MFTPFNLILAHGGRIVHEDVALYILSEHCKSAGEGEKQMARDFLDCEPVKQPFLTCFCGKVSPFKKGETFTPIDDENDTRMLSREWSASGGHELDGRLLVEHVMCARCDARSEAAYQRSNFDVDHREAMLSA